MAIICGCRILNNLRRNIFSKFRKTFVFGGLLVFKISIHSYDAVRRALFASCSLPTLCSDAFDRVVRRSFPAVDRVVSGFRNEPSSRGSDDFFDCVLLGNFVKICRLFTNFACFVWGLSKVYVYLSTNIN